MDKALAYIAGTLVTLILIIRFIPMPLETKVQWILYISVALVFFAGGTAIRFLQNTLIQVIVGAVTILVIIELIKMIPKILAG